MYEVCKFVYWYFSYFLLNINSIINLLGIRYINLLKSRVSRTSISAHTRQILFILIKPANPSGFRHVLVESGELVVHSFQHLYGVRPLWSVNWPWDTWKALLTRIDTTMTVEWLTRKYFFPSPTPSRRMDTENCNVWPGLSICTWIGSQTGEFILGVSVKEVSWRISIPSHKHNCTLRRILKTVVFSRTLAFDFLL